jgi:Cysteine-rich secretory protein family
MAPALPDAAVVETHIVEMTNAYRAKKNLGTLKRNPELRKAARAYAKFLATSNTFSHTADGSTVGKRVSKTGYRWCSIAENLAMTLDSRGFQNRSLAKKTVEGWINSPGHRENLLAPNMTEIGVAVVRAKNKHPKYVSVQVFARPKALQIEFQVSNTSKQTIHYRYATQDHTLQASSGAMHTSCTPAQLAFKDKVKGTTTPNAKTAKLKPQDGMVYTIHRAKSGGLRLKATRRETID